MTKKLTSKMRVTQDKLDTIPSQSGVYILHRGRNSRYIGSAQAGRLQKRIKEQISLKRGVTSLQYRPTSSTREARSLEKKYRDRLNPGQKI